MLDDLSVFFDPAVFGVVATRTRLLADPVVFNAIVGLADQDALDGHAIAPLRQIAFATGPDVIDGDSITLAGTGTRAAFNGVYRVRRVERVNDGLESRAILQLLAPA